MEVYVCIQKFYRNIEKVLQTPELITCIIIYIWQSRTEPPNLNLPICLQWQFGTQTPNLIPANISGYTICSEWGRMHLITAPIVAFLHWFHRNSVTWNKLYECKLVCYLSLQTLYAYLFVLLSTLTSTYLIRVFILVVYHTCTKVSKLATNDSSIVIVPVFWTN